MSKKRRSFADAINEDDISQTPQPEQVEETPKLQPETPKLVKAPALKTVSGRFPASVSSQLRILAVEQGSTAQDMLGEALNDLFRKYQKVELVPKRKS